MAFSIMHIVGARPNFMKCAPVFRALKERGAEQTLVHTGQHFDREMSAVFFEDLVFPTPKVDLGIGAGTHATQTSAVMAALEPVIIDESPMLTVLYGDVNSTLAAALVAVKLDTSIAHVEAGLRSFDMDMPEEVNRRLTDQMSDLLFVTSPEGMVHLGDESISWERTYFTGNPMIDTLRQAEPKLEPSEVQSGLSIGSSYAVVTVHRPANVDNPSTAGRLVSALHKLGGLLPVIIPLHPRGRAKLRDAGLHETSSIRVVEPMGYLDFMALVKGAAIVVTDSGGIQEETTALGVPCLTVRTTTERPITVTHGTNQLVVIENLESKASNVLAARKGGVVEADSLPPLWDGRAGRRIASVIEKWARS